MSLDKEFSIKSFEGLNVRDAADRVSDREFELLQNLWQPQKGVFANRFGSTMETLSIPYCSRISGVWRHYSSNQEKFSLYHCVPDTAILPDNTVDLTLTEVADGRGDLFNGGAIQVISVSYCWIGLGQEQRFNSKGRAGYTGVGNGTDPGHQKITVGNANSSIQVTIPAFPSGVRGANIFFSRGSSYMAYAGSITASGGSLFLRAFIALAAAYDDTIAFDVVTPIRSDSGTLSPGTYWVAAAWVCEPLHGDGLVNGQALVVGGIQTVNLTGIYNSISVTLAGPSADGATWAYVFIGTQKPSLHPATCVGLVRMDDGTFPLDEALSIYSIPYHNGQTCPDMQQADQGVGFYNSLNNGIGGNLRATSTETKCQSRTGFLMAKKNGGSLFEIFPSRSLAFEVQRLVDNEVFAGDIVGHFDTRLHNFAPQPKTQNDRYSTRIPNVGYAPPGPPSFDQPFSWGDTITDPVFCHHLGLSYWANGGDIPWQTDGYTMGQISSVKSATQTILPPIPRFIFSYQNSLVVSGSRCKNQVFASNANSPQNWATGGTDSLLRYVTIGDALGSGVTAFGALTPASDSTAASGASNPGSFMMSFKKHGIWLTSTVPDPSSSSIVGLQGGSQIPATQVEVSGSVGCTAYRTVISTPIGTVFLGSDGIVYLINRLGPPQKVGVKVQAFLAHLITNDAYMQSCTAVYHDGHYKLSYPSADAIASSPIINDSELWLDMRVEEGDKLRWMGPHLGRKIGPQCVFSGDGDDFSRLASSGSFVIVPDNATVLTDVDSSGNPVAVTKKIKSKKYRFGKEAHLKRCWGAYLDMYIDESYTHQVLLEVFADGDYQAVNKRLTSGGAIWDSSTWDEAVFADALWELYSFLFGSTNSTGRVFQFQITHSNESPWILAGITPILKPEKRRVIR